MGYSGFSTNTARKWGFLSQLLLSYVELDVQCDPISKSLGGAGLPELIYA
jgi:hypothetical protein